MEEDVSAESAFCYAAERRWALREALAHAGGIRMPQFIIERNMPGAGELAPEELKAASQGSCSVLRELGPEIQWVHSYVTDDKIYCVYRASDEDLIRKHAETAGLPANSIARVRTTIDPTTAE